MSVSWGVWLPNCGHRVGSLATELWPLGGQLGHRIVASVWRCDHIILGKDGVFDYGMMAQNNEFGHTIIVPVWQDNGYTYLMQITTTMTMRQITIRIITRGTTRFIISETKINVMFSPLFQL